MKAEKLLDTDDEVLVFSDEQMRTILGKDEFNQYSDKVTKLFLSKESFEYEEAVCLFGVLEKPLAGLENFGNMVALQIWSCGDEDLSSLAKELLLGEMPGQMSFLVSETTPKYKKAKKSDIIKKPKRKKTKAFKPNAPDSYNIINNKLANMMTKEFPYGEKVEIAVMNIGKQNEVVTYNSLTYDDKNIKISGRREFTAYDRAVHNAVCTLYESGNNIITPQMVCRVLTGKTETESVSPEAEKAVIDSIDKSMFTRLEVDYSEEAKLRNWDIDEAHINGNLLYAKRITVKTGGHKISAIEILAKPPLYEYAQLSKQIISVPISLLDTRVATRNTQDIIAIKEYLIRRIEVMKNNKKQSKNIIYDTIFNAVGIATLDKVQFKRMRTYITNILDFWVDESKYIKSYEEYKEGKNFKGIKILF